jgi:uncharacterized protein YdcH (DUF465 family)
MAVNIVYQAETWARTTGALCNDPTEEGLPYMEKSFDELKAHLMDTNDEFRRLATQHAEYKKLVEALEARNNLTEEEKVEEIRLKKLKLRLKDQMSEMMNRYRHQTV